MKRSEMQNISGVPENIVFRAQRIDETAILVGATRKAAQWNADIFFP